MQPPRGTKFGLWTVVGVAAPAVYGPTPTRPRGRTSPRTMVQCECGRRRVVLTSELHGGRSRGCRSCRAVGRNKPEVHGREMSKYERGERGPRGENE